MIKLGAQLYTVMNYIQTTKDFQRTIEKVSKIGYNTVQISGLGANVPYTECRKICDEYGVEIALTHTDRQKMIDQTDKLIEDHKILGCNYIGIGAMDGKYMTKDWIHYFAEDYLPVAEKLKENGMKLMYHNHAFDFMKVDGDKTIMDCLVEDFPADLLGITLDTFWIQAGGCPMVETIEAYKGRLDCVHLKDMKPVGNTPTICEVGEGNIDFASAIAAFERCGAKYMFVEQDKCPGFPFDSLKISYDNLVKLGYK